MLNVLCQGTVSTHIHPIGYVQAMICVCCFLELSFGQRMLVQHLSCPTCKECPCSAYLFLPIETGKGNYRTFQASFS